MEQQGRLGGARAKWLVLFEEIERAYSGFSKWPNLRQCSGVWYVSGILYEKYNESWISDGAYDCLSRYLLDNLEAAKAAGADLLKEDELRAGTAQGWQEFPRWAHLVAGNIARKCAA